MDFDMYTFLQFLEAKQNITEKVLKNVGKPKPLMILSNPNRQELADLSDFTEIHELTISSFLDFVGDDFRTLYDREDKELFIWSGFATHADLSKRFKIKGGISGFTVPKLGGNLNIELLPGATKIKLTKTEEEKIVRDVKEIVSRGKMRARVTI